ncbi:MAG: translation elongation factor Ts [Candidatus Tectomicrobia bacterium]|uniref:Elongation factor Ts n=1 Tax=Tectimicrobiota bacterium TaxID=2528274 RepID=A0A937W0C1_UNCTE|nr:translation elongation factor Ts [Candidatus Tectomicrobia bacterium]
MPITPAMIKELREKTGAGIMDCKEALTASDGAMDGAIDFLRKKGLQTAAKRAARSTQEGVVGSYIHGGGRLGVLVEVNCETDFVARTEDFQELVHDLAMHVAAANPLYLSRDEVPAETVTKEQQIYEEQAKASGRPVQAIPKIVEGRLEKYFQEACLLDQPFVKDPSQSIQDVIQAKIAKTGENITVRRFIRFQLGETG